MRLHIDHPGILCLIKSGISVGLLTQEGLILPQKGIPQGAVISPILANIYLHEFDELVSATDLKLVRYADDFLVLSRSQERILEAKLEIINLLDSMNLTLNSEKTKIANFERGFRFLGHGFLENAIFPVDANQAKLKSGIEEKQVKKNSKYEGIGAARYFPAFGKLITNSAFSFSQRFRQPPIDEVNSLLSFGYTLLFNNVLSFIIAEGLSPYIGNFHYGEKQKPYLAFDLMEEFRSPVVDSLVLKIINQSLFKPQDFDVVASTGGVYLSQSARKVFLKQFENRMNEEVSHPDLISQVTYRHAIQLQVRRYKRCLLSGVPYESFLRAG